MTDKKPIQSPENYRREQWIKNTDKEEIVRYYKRELSTLAIVLGGFSLMILLIVTLFLSGGNIVKSYEIDAMGKALCESNPHYGGFVDTYPQYYKLYSMKVISISVLCENKNMRIGVPLE